jgi:hypothetical protein
LADWPEDYVSWPAWRGWGFLLLKMVNNQLVMERAIDRAMREYARG